MDKTEPVIVARVWTEGEASVVKSLLEAYDIPSHYTSELPTRVYPIAAKDTPRIRIFVPAALAQEARELLDGGEQCETLPEPADDET